MWRLMTLCSVEGTAFDSPTGAHVCGDSRLYVVLSVLPLTHLQVPRYVETADSM